MKLLKITLGLALSRLTLSVYAQARAEPTESERIMRSMIQLQAALSLKKGLSEDPNCSKNKYPSISIDDYINLMIKMEEKDGKKSSATPSKLAETKDMLTQMVDVQIPNQGVAWKVHYESMNKAISSSSKVSGDQLCNAVNTASEGLFQKSMDNLRLIK
jgi:phenolic acid decarboxylase